jgi:hypothetical protein
LKTEGKVWVLFDSLENKKSKPLSVIQAQMLLLSLKVSSLHNYFIWTPGWSEWLPLPSFLTSGQKYFVQAQPPAPLMKKALRHVQAPAKEPEEPTRSSPSQLFTEVVAPEYYQKADYGYYYGEFTGDDLTLSGLPDRPSFKILISRAVFGADLGRRQSARHPFKIEAVLVTKKGTSFRTHSRNISMTGTLLEDEIPKDFFNKPFEVILINRSVIDPQRNRVHLTGRIVGDLSDPRRLVFEDQGEEAYNKLNSLISDYMEIQKQRIKKSAG